MSSATSSRPKRSRPCMLTPELILPIARTVPASTGCPCWTPDPGQAMPYPPDPWQRATLTELVRDRLNVLLCCSRQVGKTETVACAAYLEACDGGFVLVVSPSERQSLEFFDRL